MESWNFRKGAFECRCLFLRKRPGQTVLITAGVQAGEYVGIQSAIDLARHLQIEKVNGTIIIVKVIRREEFEHRAGSLGVKDGKNLNREFPGKADGTGDRTSCLCSSNRAVSLC